VISPEMARKCRAGIALENARILETEYADPTADPEIVRKTVELLDRLAGEIRFEVASELGAAYELVWEECRELDLCADPADQILMVCNCGKAIAIGSYCAVCGAVYVPPASIEISKATGARRPTDPLKWQSLHTSNFLTAACIHLGLDYATGKFLQRDEGNEGDRNAARILDYFSWLHYWIQDQETLAAPFVFKVLQSELERYTDRTEDSELCSKHCPECPCEVFDQDGDFICWHGHNVKDGVIG
jgi:hypothetical protein